MELKETMAELKDLVSGIKLCTSNHKTALRTAISHLETLQKVKEMGGVKRKDIKKEDWNQSVTFGDLLYAENAIIDLLHAELAGKLEGLEELLKDLIGEYFDLAGWQDKAAYKKLSNKIQELILVKKEG